MKLVTGAVQFCEGAQLLPVRGVRRGRRFDVQDWVAEEVPVALEYNGISHAVMLATPLDLEDFTLGFSLSEGILVAARELFSVEAEPSALGVTVHLQVSGAAFARLRRRRRSPGRAHRLRPVRHREPGRRCRANCWCFRAARAAAQFDREAIGRAMSQLPSQQTLQEATGAVHAAAWCSAEGEVMWLRARTWAATAPARRAGRRARGQ